MKCNVCGAPAAINMREHRLRLCAPHFLAWMPGQVERTIARYQMFSLQEPILVAVSGGKDSLTLWDILLNLGYQADGLHINLGIGEGYSEASQAKVEAFAAQHPAARLRIINVAADYGMGVPDLQRARKGRKICALCGLIKRHIMNESACAGGYTTIATGHNLDDEAAVLLQNTLHWNVSYLARQGPVLPGSPGLARKVKPLCRLRERETAAYALVRKIDYIYDECIHARGAQSLFQKDLLNRLEAHSPGSLHAFYLEFLQARERYDLFRLEREELVMQPCPRCGQPTTAPGLCAFCRLWAAPEEPPAGGELDPEARAAGDRPSDGRHGGRPSGGRHGSRPSGGRSEDPRSGL